MPCRASSSSFRVCETRFRPPSSGGAPMETVSVTSARRCVASACLFSAVDPPLHRIEAAAPRRCCPPSSEPIEPPLPRTSGGGVQLREAPAVAVRRRLGWTRCGPLPLLHAGDACGLGSPPLLTPRRRITTSRPAFPPLAARRLGQSHSPSEANFDSVVKCGFKAYSYVLEFLSLSPHALAIYCVLHDARCTRELDEPLAPGTSEVRAAGTQPCRVQPLRDKGDLFPLPL
ncbi:hypothetical protein SASPL_155878 [Salvia splendens]|uniref:Uncharacterized protein n=1 Tax=Salvia splendens TaxID=180675 RepID=A0A8X8VY09_SALSN|nr:hypothetical protein SASPL_155878 [Salvia splendens]